MEILMLVLHSTEINQIFQYRGEFCVGFPPEVRPGILLNVRTFRSWFLVSTAKVVSLN